MFDAPLAPFKHDSTFKLTERPNPNWKPGDGLGDTPSAREWRAAEKQGWKTVNPGQTDGGDLYRLMKSAIIPRPIAFVSSISENGVPNLAPFSWFNMLSHLPPLVMFSASPTAKGDKDTTANVRCTKEFTVNIISVPWADAANFASIEAPENVSEWAASGLTMEQSTLVKPTWVRETAFAMECEVYQIIDVPVPPSPSSSYTSTDRVETLQSIIIGLVKLIHVRNAVLTPRGTVDPALLRPLARLGSTTYATLGDGFDIPKLIWGDFEEQVNELEKQASDRL